MARESLSPHTSHNVLHTCFKPDRLSLDLHSCGLSVVPPRVPRSPTVLWAARSPTALCTAGNHTHLGLECLVQPFPKPESADDWNSWVTWLRTVCLVWGGGRQEHTNHKLHHFTNLSKRPSWALCIHVEGTIILIPKWNQNPSLCICPVSQLCAPCRKSLNPLASGHFPHIPPPTLANTLPLPQAPVPSHHYLPFLPSGAPGLRHLQCSGWVPQFWHQIALVKSVSKICSKTCSQWWAFCVSVSSSLKWGWW